MAYAAVISLKHTIQRLLNSTIPQITTSAADEELEFLKDTLTKLDGSSCNRSVVNSLDAQIREAASKLEDVLEFYIKGVQDDIDLFVKTVKKLGEEYNKEIGNPLSMEEDEAAVSPIDDSKTVGMADQFEEIMNDLIDLQPGFKIVSLYGMSGIGKTHLASKVNQHPNIVQEFDVRVCASIGPKFRIENVLADIAAQIDQNPRNECMFEDKYKLGDRVYKSLSGQRYLVVLDDIWSTAAWSAMKRWFPIERNGSRIVLTTRLEEVAKYPASSNAYQIRWLNNDESWDLLWRTVFAPKNSFPSKLEKAGRKIAENCEGLPLLILEVAKILREFEKLEDAKILREFEKTEAFWMEAATKKTVFPDAYENISKVLLSSYEYLPQYLKACFLYMGGFPQNSVIPISKLMELWTIEDFLEPNQSQTAEVFAMNCLKKLVSQSLAMICKHSSSNGIKSSKLHSAYWHLCVREARKNRFLHVLNSKRDGTRDCIDRQRCLSVQNNILFGIKDVFSAVAENSMTRSLLCTGKDHPYQVPICYNLMLLKVLDALALRFYEFPDEVVKLLQLRYLALTSNGKLPPSISMLQQLQCLILRQHHNIKLVRDSDSSYFPVQIWDMPELRHLRIMGSSLPDPSNEAQLPNLSTLHVDAHSCTYDVFKSIPKLKKLGIRIELQPDAAETISCFEHISILDELEVLKCGVLNPRLRSGLVAPPEYLFNLPIWLKKLSLSGFGYSWKYMSAIGRLPYLQVLKLQCCAFQGAEWEIKAEEFQKLEYLLLEDLDLEHWTTDDKEWFPCLRNLVIRNCYKLKTIPPEIGAVPVLKTIELVDCSPSAVASAWKIKKDEEDYGNFYLQVVISSSWK